MDASPKPRKIYQSHREQQRVRILESAEMLFIRSGIDGVSLADIANNARLSRVTVYEYFPNKQEIAWAVFQKVVAEMSAPLGEPISPEMSSGHQKLTAFFDFRLKQLETNPEHLRYIAIFNYLYAREGGGARMRSTLEQTRPGLYGLPAEWIRSGIADGSIRPDVDADLVSAAIFNLLAGMESRFSLLGPVLQEEYGQNVTDLYHEICQNFLLGLRAR